MGKTNLGRVTFVPRGTYSNKTAYKRLDVVEYEGSSYLFLKDSTGITPTGDSEVTMLLAKKGKDFTYDDFTPEQLAALKGADGKDGLKGDKGDPGKGLTILGYYSTLDLLKAAVTTPEPGDAYGIGIAAPYDIYVFDGVTNDWVNNGKLSGGGSIDKLAVETVLRGNIITHSHDTIFEKPECDVLNIETLEVDIRTLVGDGSTFPLLGEGTESNPYVIDSALKWVFFQAEVLNYTSNESKRYFSLFVNCDLGGLEIPMSTSPVSANSKIQYSVNGNGHFIRNFTLIGKNTLVAPFPILGVYDANNSIHITSPYEKIDTDIKNIGFKDAIYKLRCDKNLGTTYATVAGIAGLVMNTTGKYPERSAIQNCYLDNIQLNVENYYSNSGTGAQIVISSLFGVNMIGNIKDCYAKGMKVYVNSVGNSNVEYCPFAYSPWAFDYFLFENIYTEATIEANQEVIQTFPSIANIVFNNCFFCSNYISETIPQGVTSLPLDMIKTVELSTALGHQFEFDGSKNDGYPFLIGQDVENLIYDGYVRKSEIGNQLGNSSSDVFKISASISGLTASSTSEQIANAIGGINGFHAIKDAIRNFKRLIFYLEESGLTQWMDIGIKACGTGEISEGVQGEMVLLGVSEGSVPTMYIINYNPVDNTFSIQIQK